MSAPNIKPFSQIVPMIYAYTTPEIERHNGWTKIGYTEAQTVESRIKQQTHTADVAFKLEWQDNAMYKDGSGEYFTDKAFHGFLTGKKGVQQEENKNNEWFHIEPMPALALFNEFASRKVSVGTDDEQLDYTLRPEQDDAVADTLAYFQSGGTEFLWNAKPRFGKTLTTYDLVRRMAASQEKPMMVLVVTNRPSIANSWADDFFTFVGWREELAFVSINPAVRDRPGVLSYQEFLKYRTECKVKGKRAPGMVAFESLQGIKGSVYFGGDYDKLEWMKDVEFDLLIVDESQEGVDTRKTDRAFANIRRRHTLYLSGTPFRALADGRFGADQIYNWSYADEQQAKRTFSGEGFNAYEVLPELQMYTYQMSAIVEGELRRGAAIGENENIDYAFDLNEFFSVDGSGRFKHHREVERFLDALTTQERYPFSAPELRGELSHTLWLLNRVASAEALARLLKTHPVFGEYKVVLAVGSGRSDEDEDAADSYKRVKTAIAENGKTITLSVGQLTVGVTVPEWTGILMLSNMKSPSSYMQAAFRVQNPYETTVLFEGKPQRVRKDRAYVFDFDPARTLVIFDEFANNLRADTAGGHGTAEDRRGNIQRLLNFFPVLGEDEAGRMVEIDAQAVLSIPRRLKSMEVVRHGFMSNYLFANIGAVFGAPTAVADIVKKFTMVKEEEFDAQRKKMTELSAVTDGSGEVDIPHELVIGKSTELFGKKVYESVSDAVTPVLGNLLDADDLSDVVESVGHIRNALKHHLVEAFAKPAAEDRGLKRTNQKAVIKELESGIDKEFARLEDDYCQQVKIAEIEFRRAEKVAQSAEDVERAKEHQTEALNQAFDALHKATRELTEKKIGEAGEIVSAKAMELKVEEDKAGLEDEIRAHLRGFARTIPSFIMAYGDENLTLANFDDYTEDDVFEEVTGITEEQFRFLRDGGDYIEEKTGEIGHFAGGLFDETAFNDSIREFLTKRDELADYFDETHDEDIFDYIPAQKTNQIFTPRWVVKLMVDKLEEENPGCYDDPAATFADLYMKSGLYITEVTKRLFRSDAIRRTYPDDAERIRHILSKQVYGMAPTRIIYLIAMNYIFGFDNGLHEQAIEGNLPNFAQADAAKAAKSGMLQQLVDECFGVLEGA